MKCNKCDGKGWDWPKGTDFSEDCSWCEGTGKSKELDEPTVKLIESAAVKEYPKTSFLKALFHLN